MGRMGTRMGTRWARNYSSYWDQKALILYVFCVKLFDQAGEGCRVMYICLL